MIYTKVSHKLVKSNFQFPNFLWCNLQHYKNFLFCKFCKTSRECTGGRFRATPIKARKKIYLTLGATCRAAQMAN